MLVLWQVKPLARHSCAAPTHPACYRGSTRLAELGRSAAGSHINTSAIATLVRVPTQGKRPCASIHTPVSLKLFASALWCTNRSLRVGQPHKIRLLRGTISWSAMDEAAHGTGFHLGTTSRPSTGLAACCGPIGKPLIASCLEEVLQSLASRAPKGLSADL